MAFALQLRKKHGKPSVRVRKTSVRVRKPSVKVQYAYYQKHPHITKPLQTHTLQNPLIHTHRRTHTLQNNIKPPQYKLKQNAYRKSNSTSFLMLLIHRYSTPFLTGPSLHCTSPHFTSPTINTLHSTPRFNPLHCTTLHFISIHCTF